MKTNFSKKLCLITALLLAACLEVAGAQQSAISIDSNVDKSTIRIGDLIRYSIAVTHNPDIEVESPGLAANLGAFEIRDYQVLSPQSVDGQTVQRVEYVISTFDIGEFEIPPLTFHYTIAGDSTSHELKTRKLTIQVESLKPSEAGDIRDIKAPLTLPRDLWKYIFWGSIALAVVVLAGVLLYIWRRRKAGKGLIPQKVEPPRPAHEVALEELNAIKNSSLLAEGRIKEFYIQVSDIIRRYIEGRYFIVALELTTLELIENLRAANIEAKHEALIHKFLDTCDLVKFAKLRPSPAENGKALQLAFEIVETTKLTYDYTGTDEENGSAKPVEAQEEELAPTPSDEVEDTK